LNENAVAGTTLQGYTPELLEAKSGSNVWTWR